ncbi:MAG: hypothetical protein ACRDY0_06045, partial [Acidimicrobiales bacterium]
PGGPGSAGEVGEYHSSAPTRIADTRCGAASPPGSCAGEALSGPNAALATPASGGALRVAIGTPRAEAVVLNVTVTGTASSGFLTAYPDGTARPLASNGNWVPGQTAASRVIVPVGADGYVDLYNGSPASADFVVDMVGYYAGAGADPAGGSRFVPVAPARVTDTRPGSNQANMGSTLGAAGNLTVAPGALPVGAAAVVVNLTVAISTAGGFLTVMPQAPSGTVSSSDLNFGAGEVRANADIASLSPSDTFDVFNHAGLTDAVVDITGYFVYSR